jgi:hypothetical protein
MLSQRTHRYERVAVLWILGLAFWLLAGVSMPETFFSVVTHYSEIPVHLMNFDFAAALQTAIPPEAPLVFWSVFGLACLLLFAGMIELNRLSLDKATDSCRRPDEWERENL